METFLSSLTQHATNYAIRSGIAITSTYAIRECSRLLKIRSVKDGPNFEELKALKNRLDGKITIITPAIDVIDLISARGNTTLSSAMTLTKSLRWDIQSLGNRFQKVANAEELLFNEKKRMKERSSELDIEILQIIEEIKKLLVRIDDAVPLINLAITTSGASLSTSLPPTVSPSRLLQASSFLSGADIQFSITPTCRVAVGPPFTLSVYMLFAGHTHRPHNKESDIRQTTWKEVIHKARIRLLRLPFERAQLKSTSSNHLEPSSLPGSPVIDNGMRSSIEEDTWTEHFFSEGLEFEFNYVLEIIEDHDDGRMHDEGESEPYTDIPRAGIRELIPIYQISKIFYADTGKMLNIGKDGESNSPVLLLKRDVNAPHPREMMQYSEFEHGDAQESGSSETKSENGGNSDDGLEDSQADIDKQLRSETHKLGFPEGTNSEFSKLARSWCFPADLDHEWLAFEIYTGDDNDSSEEDEPASYDSAYVSGQPSSAHETLIDSTLSADMAHFRLDSSSPASRQTSKSTLNYQQTLTPAPLSRNHSSSEATPSPLKLASQYGPIRSSLSLLEMLIRLTVMQNSQQKSHLAIPDELLNFFLVESSTSGAGRDGEERRRVRGEAKQKVGFDPYDDTPMKLLDRNSGEFRGGYQTRSRGETPCDDSDEPRQYSGIWLGETGSSQHGTPESWLRNRKHSGRSRRERLDTSSSPVSPYIPRRSAGPVGRLQQRQSKGKASSSLGRGKSVDTDSSLGTSPGTPNLGELEA